MSSRTDDSADLVTSTTMILYGMIVIVSAIALAVKLNPSHPYAMSVVAFLFPEIYIFQHVFRKYVVEPHLC